MDKSQTFKRKKDRKEIWGFLKEFKDEEVKKAFPEQVFEKLIYWIEENILFYNPLDGTIRPQSRLLWRAIREVM